MLPSGGNSERDLLADRQPGEVGQDRATDAMGVGEPQTTIALQKLVAACLLDPATTIPVDSQGLHRKLSKPELALQYEEALTKAGDASLDSVLKELGAGDNAYLEVEDFEVAGKQRTMVLDINRPRLESLVGGPQAAKGPAGPVVSLPGPPMPSLPLASQPGHPQQQPLGPPAFPPGHPGAQGGFMPGGLPGPPARLNGAPGPFPSGPMPPQMPPQMGFPGPMGMHGPRPLMGPGGPGMPMPMPMQMLPPRPPMFGGPRPDNALDALLSRPTIRDRVKSERGEELLELIQKPTAKESATVQRFRTEGGPAVREFCPSLTKDDCRLARGHVYACDRVHFRRLVFPWTDVSLGNCSYLDTCRHMRSCKYVHYELDDEPDAFAGVDQTGAVTKPRQHNVPAYLQALGEPQWLQCDIRKLDMAVLGKFGVIMADPPWEIHQDLPYGTMADDEMRNMNLQVLQDEGVIFLWVTGRAMELGRECLEIWGYRRVDELIWVKTNQLQRLIRTGRTGHWLNHSKEHCLVGVKGNPPQINRNLDCDVLVAEVRETSRKPDEMYSLLERLSPGTRKIEIFARQHNVRPGWVSLGNQLDGVKIREPEMQARYDAVYGPSVPGGKEAAVKAGLPV
ncbi:hypothetical protein WJX72_000802 [[Myrmecia] bisecta]|uniref:Uncharacterized protein n=1 Tax=[Myrmecia] bisecta TaxID=41462 RepID=A0AAW1QE07_9CHLO